MSSSPRWRRYLNAAGRQRRQGKLGRRAGLSNTLVGATFVGADVGADGGNLHEFRKRRHHMPQRVQGALSVRDASGTPTVRAFHRRHRRPKVYRTCWSKPIRPSELCRRVSSAAVDARASTAARSVSGTKSHMNRWPVDIVQRCQ